MRGECVRVCERRGCGVCGEERVCGDVSVWRGENGECVEM